MSRTIEGHDGGVLALIHVDNTIWSGAADKTIRVWDAQVSMAAKKLRRGEGKEKR